MSHIVTVTLDNRSYDINIGAGLLESAGQHILPLLKNKRVAIVTDETVANLHLSTLQTSLESAGIESKAYILPAGESTKSFEQLQSLLSNLLDDKWDRSDFFLAFGGGVIGDLTGFAASVYKRGCGFIQIPTTLLAQVDSSVGGKTGINMPHGKNLIGAFYQPALVLADTDVLSTLDKREVQAGYAEVLKYGLLGDAKFFDWLEINAKDVLTLETEALSYAVAVSCQTKARFVAADEREQGQRALLNLGHTFGHALEAEGGYDGTLLHGEAVAAGMALAFDYSAARGICSEDNARKVSNHLKNHGLIRFADLPAKIQASPEKHMHHMAQDKKNSGGALTLILARAIGDSYVEKAADIPSVTAFWAAQIHNANNKES